MTQHHDDDIRLLFPAYATGTASDEESNLVEEFVRRDLEARAELDDFLAIMAGNGAASPQAEPPADLREQIVGTVAAANRSAAPEAVPAARPVAKETPWWQRGFAIGTVGLAAAASLAAVAFLGVQNQSLQGDLDETRDLVAQSQEAQDASQGFEIADVQMTSFDTMNEFENVNNMAVMVDGHGMLVLREVPDPPMGHHYQVWEQHANGQMTKPAKAMEGSDVLYLDLGDVEGTDVTKVMVTVEVNGEEPAEPGPMVLQGEMA